MLLPMDRFSDPDIYLSIDKEVPDDNLASADFYDTSLGYDVMSIDKGKFKVNTTFYITVTCSRTDNCNYKINVQKTGDYTMSAGQRIRLFYREQAEELIYVKIPEINRGKSNYKNPYYRVIRELLHDGQDFSYVRR